VFLIKFCVAYAAVASLIWMLPRIMGNEDNDPFDSLLWIMGPVMWVMLLVILMVYFFIRASEYYIPVVVERGKFHYSRIKLEISRRMHKRRSNE